MTDLDLMAAFEAEFSALDPDSRGRSLMNGNGRYDLPRRDGSKKPWGWMRATNLAGAFADQKALQDWQARTQLWGLRANPEIVDEFLAERIEDVEDPNKVRETLDAYVRRLHTAGGGDIGAQRGNIRHAIVEAEHAGLPVHVRPRLRAGLDNYRAALADGGLVAVPGMQELTVLNERYEVCGTLDNVLQDLTWGVYRIGDLKSQKRFYGWLEIIIQLYVYATSDAILNKETWTWEDWPLAIDWSTSLVAWWPHDHPDREHGVDIYEVDTWNGRRLADLAHQIVKERSAAKSKARPWGRVRPAEAIAPLSERWMRRAQDAGSLDQLRAVVAGAKQAGVWDVVKLAVISRERALRTPSVLM